MEDLLSLLNNALIASFLKGDGCPRDRREAVPIPLIVLIRWEEAILNPSTPAWLKLLLGGYLLACWASLRFADLQRTDIGSLNLATNSLRGVCRVTKTTRTGQPFAVLLAVLLPFWENHPKLAGFTIGYPLSKRLVQTFTRSHQISLFR